jgi:hypothetical protein
LYEEICVLEDDFNEGNIHYLSINFEGDIANFAFVCVVKLQIDSQTLSDRLLIEPRIDNEFKNFDFINIDEIPKELINSSRKYHPSSRIRMIYTYLHFKGASQFKYQLLKSEYGK